jgi:hypothetical protein
MHSIASLEQPLNPGTVRRIVVLRPNHRLGQRLIAPPITWGVADRDRMLTDLVDMTGAPAHIARVPVYLLRSGMGSGVALPAHAESVSGPLDLRLSESERFDGERRLASAFGSLAAPPRPRRKL